MAYTDRNTGSSKNKNEDKHDVCFRTGRKSSGCNCLFCSHRAVCPWNVSGLDDKFFDISRYF